MEAYLTSLLVLVLINCGSETSLTIMIEKKNYGSKPEEYNNMNLTSPIILLQ
jgi:hypothetical protein